MGMDINPFPKDISTCVCGVVDFFLFNLISRMLIAIATMLLWTMQGLVEPFPSDWLEFALSLVSSFFLAGNFMLHVHLWVNLGKSTAGPLNWQSKHHTSPQAGVGGCPLACGVPILPWHSLLVHGLLTYRQRTPVLTQSINSKAWFFLIITIKTSCTSNSNVFSWPWSLTH